MIHIIKIFKSILTFTFWKLAGNVVGCELELELELEFAVVELVVELVVAVTCLDLEAVLLFNCSNIVFKIL